MAYSDFNLSRVSTRFGLDFREQELFEGVAEIPVGPVLAPILARHEPLARAINTEKARSEFLIAPVLGEIRSRLDDRISLFSGVDLPADAQQGLNGTCDFLISRSDQQFFLTRPIVAVVEAKKDDPATGYGQCIATLLGARIFNERRQQDEPTLHGVVTSGTLWRFLRLEGSRVVLDRREYQIDHVGKILGILLAMLDPKGPR